MASHSIKYYGQATHTGASSLCFKEQCSNLEVKFESWKFSLLIVGCGRLISEYFISSFHLVLLLWSHGDSFCRSWSLSFSTLFFILLFHCYNKYTGHKVLNSFICCRSAQAIICLGPTNELIMDTWACHSLESFNKSRLFHSYGQHKLGYDPQKKGTVHWLTSVSSE